MAEPDRQDSSDAIDAIISASALSDLRAIEGVEAVSIEEERGKIHLICRSEGGTSSPMEVQARSILLADGIPDSSLPQLQVSYLFRPEVHRRIRIEGISVVAIDVRQWRATVDLEWDGRVETGAALGPPSEAAKVRLAAEATLDGLRQVVEDRLRFRLLGVKIVSAFDHDMVVALLRPEVERSSRLVGVAIADEGVEIGAVRAVLNATNRILGNYLTVSE